MDTEDWTLLAFGIETMRKSQDCTSRSRKMTVTNYFDIVAKKTKTNGCASIITRSHIT